MRCTRIKAFHLKMELAPYRLHVLIVVLREHSYIHTHQFVVRATSPSLTTSLINGINDMGVIVAKTEAKYDKRTSYLTGVVITVLKILVMRYVLHLFIAVACSNKDRVRSLFKLLVVLLFFKDILSVLASLR